MNIICILCLIITLLYCTLISIYIYGWIKTPEYAPADKKPATFVSIIVPARNEEQTISECLQSILLQDYPKNLYEIIVVDDDSSDNTVSVAEAIKQETHNLHLVRLKDEPGIKAFKKRAISKALGQAKGSLIVTTDADCVAGNKWISTIVDFYEKEKPKMIVSPVVFHEEKNAFEKIQSLEFTGLMAITAAAIYFRVPVMCNGANLAYEKDVFKAVRGFEGIDDIASGDDVLLMNKIHKAFPSGVQYLRSSLAVVSTQASSGLFPFVQQRIRWASKAIKSRSGHNFISAGIVFGFNAFALATIFLSVFYIPFFYLFGFMALSKCLIDFLLLISPSRFVNKRSFLAFLVPAQLLYYLYIVIIGFFAILGKYEWKGRRID